MRSGGEGALAAAAVQGTMVVVVRVEAGQGGEGARGGGAAHLLLLGGEAAQQRDVFLLRLATHHALDLAPPLGLDLAQLLGRLRLPPRLARLH